MFISLEAESISTDFKGTIHRFNVINEIPAKMGSLFYSLFMSYRSQGRG